MLAPLAARVNGFRDDLRLISSIAAPPLAAFQFGMTVRVSVEILSTQNKSPTEMVLRSGLSTVRVTTAVPLTVAAAVPLTAVAGP